MIKKYKILEYLNITGIVLFILGTLDPLEGSILIVIGSFLIAYSSYYTKNIYKNIFIINFILICAGVAAMWILSSMGGFGGTSSLSAWWGLSIITYPIGWLLEIIFLIMNTVNKRKAKNIEA